MTEERTNRKRKPSELYIKLYNINLPCCCC